MKLLQVFNQYKERGGEEKSAQRIFDHISCNHEVHKFWLDSRAWEGVNAPNKITQACKMFYNKDSSDKLRIKLQKTKAEAIISHNIYPVGSPSIYHIAQKKNIPVVQFIHNFRPFSISGNLWLGGRVAESSLEKKYFNEVIAGSWQQSVIKSAIFAGMLHYLHATGWLQSIKKWVAISDFMRQRFIEAGIDENKIVTLRHSWDCQWEQPSTEEGDYYLFLSRLVPEKGTATLLKAWYLLENKMGDKCPKLIIGGVGPEEEIVRDAAQNSNKIVYKGFVSGSSKMQLIKKCRGMLAPSVWWEPLGLVTYEAYDAGKLMLAAASGGLTETVMHEKTGFLHTPGDGESLCRTIISAENLSSEERIRFGHYGRDWLQNNASPAEWKKRFNTILSGVNDK